MVYRTTPVALASRVHCWVRVWTRVWILEWVRVYVRVWFFYYLKLYLRSIRNRDWDKLNTEKEEDLFMRESKMSDCNRHLNIKLFVPNNYSPIACRLGYGLKFICCARVRCRALVLEPNINVFF